MSKILVTGATGHLGSAVVNHLLKKTDASNIKILARDESKVTSLVTQGIEVSVGDYADYNTLIAAFKGIDKLYLVSGTDLANRESQQKNVINAAKDAGIKHVIYTSFQRKNETDSSPIALVSKAHLATEKAIIESGLKYTFLLDGLYADVIPFFAGEQLLSTKTLYFPAKDGKTSFALREDIAEASANILVDNSGKYENKALEITGYEALTWKQIADLVTIVTGEQIAYVSPDINEYRSTLIAANIPNEFVIMLSGFASAIAQGEFENVSSDLENILGRRPVSVETYLKTIYQK